VVAIEVCNIFDGGPMDEWLNATVTSGKDGRVDLAASANPLCQPNDLESFVFGKKRALDDYRYARLSE